MAEKAIKATRTTTEKEYFQKINARVMNKISPINPKERKLEETNESEFMNFTGINLN